MAKQIKKSELTDLVEKGYKMKELAQHYEIPVMRMKDIVKQAGLRIKSNRGETVILVDDTDEIEELARVSVEELSNVDNYKENLTQMSFEDIPEFNTFANQEQINN